MQPQPAHRFNLPLNSSIWLLCMLPSSPPPLHVSKQKHQEPAARSPVMWIVLNGVRMSTSATAADPPTQNVLEIEEANISFAQAGLTTVVSHLGLCHRNKVIKFKAQMGTFQPSSSRALSFKQKCSLTHDHVKEGINTRNSRLMNVI